MKSVGIKLAVLVISWAVVALGQPAWISGLAPLAACVGFAAFWKVAAEIPFSKQRFWLGTAWFGAVQLVQLSWMTSMEFHGLYILVVYALLALLLGFQFGLVTLFIDKIPLLATAAIWTLMEWARLHFLCGFSWNPVGLSLTAIPFSLQAASLFGILGLSFLVILTNLAFWKRRQKVGLALACFPYIFGVIQMWMQVPQVDRSATMTVGLVQTGLLPSEKIVIQDRTEEFISPYEQWRRIVMLIKNSPENLDMVVLPEFAVPMAENYKGYSSTRVRQILEETLGPVVTHLFPELRRAGRVSNRFWIQSISKIVQADVIAGLEAEEDGLHYTSALFCPHRGGEIERYDKQVLLPLAEYVPFEWAKVLTRFYGISEFFTHGKEAKVFSSKVPIAASICYEETFSHLMRQGRVKGGDLFVNLTNDNWYANSRLPKQHFDHARLRAVENGVPMVRACNRGMTAAVDSLGRIIGQIVDEQRTDLLVAKVPLHHFFTLYSIWGDWGILILSAGFLLVCLYANRRQFISIRGES